MKRENLLLSLILCCWITICSSQKLIWTNLFGEYSDAQSMIKTTDGRILMVGAFYQVSLFIASYDTEGKRLKRTIIPEMYRTSISLIELDSGDFLLFTYSGNIWLINSRLNAAKIIFSVGFEIISAFHLANESIIFGNKNKLVFNTKTFQALSRDTLITNTNKYAYHFSGDTEFYFDITDQFVSMTKKQNSQTLVSQFKNIDSMFDINNTFRCNNGDFLLIGYRIEKTIERIESTILYRLSEEGELKWSKKFIYSNLSSIWRAYKLLNHVTETINGDLLFTGTNGIWPVGPISDILYVKLDSAGNVKTDVIYNYCSEGDVGKGILELNNEIYIAATVCSSDFGQPDRALLMKIDNLTTEVENEVVPQFSIQPNPSSGKLIVQFYQNDMDQISLFSALGSLIKTIDVTNKNKIEFQFIDLQSGIYFIQCTDRNGRSAIKKWIKN